MNPRFLPMDDAAIEALLARNYVGRVAFARRNQIEIIPVHYVFVPGWVYGRTTPGGRIDQMGDPWWPVAFQVDEIRGMFDWESVVIKGGLYVVPADGATWEREAWAEGVEALRRLMPQVLTDDDPVPQRSTVFRIAIQEAIGRAATTRQQ